MIRLNTTNPAKNVQIELCHIRLNTINPSEFCDTVNAEINESWKSFFSEHFQTNQNPPAKAIEASQNQSKHLKTPAFG